MFFAAAKSSPISINSRLKIFTRLAIPIGKLLDAKVGGQELDDDRTYTVSTIDYLAEGNDHLDTFRKFKDSDKLMPKGAKIRQLLLNYVTAMEKQGKTVNAKIEGRTTIKD